MLWPGQKNRLALRPKSLNRKKRIIVFLLLSIQTERSPMEKSENFREVTFSCSLFIMNLVLNKVCRKIRDKHHYDYDLNAILSDLIYTRILEPGSKRSSFETAKNFLEAPTYQLHDIYRALNVLSEECDLIQSELYRNSKSVLKRNDGVLYYDCTNYYFEIEQEDGDKKIRKK